MEVLRKSVAWDFLACDGAIAAPASHKASVMLGFIRIWSYLVFFSYITIAIKKRLAIFNCFWTEINRKLIERENWFAKVFSKSGEAA